MGSGATLWPRGAGSACAGSPCVGRRLQGSWASVVAAWRLGSVGPRALEHRLSSLHLGLLAPQRVGSSQTRDRTHVSCTGSRFFITETLGKPSIDSFNRESLSLHSRLLSQLLSCLFFFFLINTHLLFDLAAPGLSCKLGIFSCSVSSYMQHVGPSPLPRDQTWALCFGGTESQPLGHQGGPLSCFWLHS